MQNYKSKKTKKQSPATPAVCDYMKSLFIDEIKENNRFLDFDHTVKGLSELGIYLSTTGTITDDADLKDQMIDGLGAVVSALSFLSLMHTTINSYRSIEGGSSC